MSVFLVALRSTVCFNAKFYCVWLPLSICLAASLRSLQKECGGWEREKEEEN